MQIILDIGVNYYELAKQDGSDLIAAAGKMIKTAAENKIKIVKFQSYKADKLVTDDACCYWDNQYEKHTSQKKLFSNYDKLILENYQTLKKYCDEYGVEFMCTAFDPQSLDDINPLVKCHKIASADITNYELLHQVAKYKKPVILSVGAADYYEILEALDVLGNVNITLLHCMLLYPTPVEQTCLWRIAELKRAFPNHRIGYSDHAIYNPAVILAAKYAGAQVIEKHFTMTPDAQGNDHYHAVSDKQLYEFRQICQSNPEQAYLGMIQLQENARRNARRGVYLKRDVKQNQVCSFSDVEFLRPQGGGISPMEFADYVMDGLSYGRNYSIGEQI